jgi:superfamily II DNA or RNA helicase
MFHVSVKRSLEAVEQFKAAGIDAEHIDGETDPAVRDTALERFENGDLMVVSNVALFVEGTDIAGVQTLIDCAPSMSLGSVMQRWGRVLRPAPGKVALILDHAGNSGEKHGYPDTPRQWSLEGRTKRKKKDPEDVTLRRCPVCIATLMGYVSKCDACGHVFEREGREVEEVAGELTEVDTEVAVHQRKEEQRKARSEDELIAMGRARGYKRPELWARHVTRARRRSA